MWEPASGHSKTSKVFNTVNALDTYQFSYVSMPVLKFKYWTDSAVWTLIGNSDTGLGWRKIYVCCLAHHLFMLSFWPNDFGRRMTDFHPSFMDFLWKKYHFFILFPFFTCCILYQKSHFYHTANVFTLILTGISFASLGTLLFACNYCTDLPKHMIRFSWYNVWFKKPVTHLLLYTEPNV